MKVLVLGASGIIGQHLMVSTPDGVQATFCNRTEFPYLWISGDITDLHVRETLLSQVCPDVIINLAGENSVDFVEQNKTTTDINISVPQYLANYCAKDGATYIHISSNAVFDGTEDQTFSPDSPDMTPRNKYGKEKLAAEGIVKGYPNAVIIRATFVLGVRKVAIGRTPPAEQILTYNKLQTDDKYFSVLDAQDCAEYLWRVVKEHQQHRGKILHFSSCEKVSRYAISKVVHKEAARPIHQEHFVNAAPRPTNTSYSQASSFTPARSLEDIVARTAADFIERKTFWSPTHQLQALALYFQKNIAWAKEQMYTIGFKGWHKKIAEEFNSINPQSDDALLSWYRSTNMYIFELAAYHLDTGFNYPGSCQSVESTLKQHHRRRVLILGDGIGDFTSYLHSQGFNVFYNDLKDSQVFKFAQFNFWLRFQQTLPYLVSTTFSPPITPFQFDAIVALDVFEHLPNVEEWLRWCHTQLYPGGLLIAQNAFGCGSAAHGNSIPMHLACNDQYEKLWDIKCREVGFTQLKAQTYQKDGVDVSTN